MTKATKAREFKPAGEGAPTPAPTVRSAGHETGRLAQWCRSLVGSADEPPFELMTIIDGFQSHYCFPETASPRSAAQKYVLGCVQDFLSGVLVAELAAEGVLDLTVPLSEYLPELNSGTAPGRLILLPSLLNHGSGFWADLHRPEIEGWGDVLTLLTHGAPVFPPGRVVSYGLLERVLLLQLIHRVTGQTLYDHLEARFLRALHTSATVSPSPYLANLGLKEIEMSIADLGLVTRHVLETCGAWVAQLRADGDGATAAICDPSRLTKPMIPIANRFGVADFGGGLWGQNGSSTASFVGLRLDPARRRIVAGGFVARQRRDVAMSQLGELLDVSDAKDAKSRALGTMGGIPLDELTGAYQGSGGDRLEVRSRDGDLFFLLSRGGKPVGAIRGRLTPTGEIVSTSSWPGLWLQAFRHPQTREVCLMLGMYSYIRLQSEAR